MGIQSLPRDVLVVNLPAQPQYGHELEDVNRMLSETVAYDVVINFADVQMLTSETICGLMILDKLLRGGGRQLVLYNLSSSIKQIFVRTGLVTVFHFADDDLSALEQIHSHSLCRADTAQ